MASKLEEIDRAFKLAVMKATVVAVLVFAASVIVFEFTQDAVGVAEVSASAVIGGVVAVFVLAILLSDEGA